MNKYIISLTLSIALLTGCATTGNQPQLITPSRVKAVTYLGTAVALQAHPEYKPGFQIAVHELKIIESQDKIDFAVVLKIINDLPIKEIRSGNAAIYITAATLLFDDLGAPIDIGKVEKMKPYVTALREGLELALQ